MDQQELLTVPEIALRLKVHQETVRRWLREGRLRGRNFGGKMGYRIKAEDLVAFLEGEEVDLDAKIAA